MKARNTFAAKHPAAAQWEREGGLFADFPEAEAKKAEE